MNGWMGKLLRVNLTRGSASVEELPRWLARVYLGGRGLATRILYDEMDAELDALSPDNKMVFMTGPLTGTSALGGASYVVVTKSPLSGSIASSTAEGYFGPELKFAGYDGIILEGRAAEPVYLSIEDEKVELLSASHLWGKSTLKTEELIRREKENCWVAQETSVATMPPMARLGAFSTVTAVTPETSSGNEVTPASKIAPTQARPRPVFSTMTSA